MLYLTLNGKIWKNKIRAIKTLQEKNYFCSVLYKDKYCYMYWTSGQKKAKIRTDFLEK